MICPFYQAVQAEDPLKKVKGYCVGYLNGKLRIPSIYEEVTLCTTMNYRTCQVFSVRMEEEATDRFAWKEKKLNDPPVGDNKVKGV